MGSNVLGLICIAIWMIGTSAMALAATPAPAAQPAAKLSEPWQAPYAGADATGPHVIGLWQFKKGAELQDSSPNALNLKLQGAAIAEQGLFDGPCLESFCGFPIEDKRHAALVANAPKLSPIGAFTIEMWIKAKPELEKYPESFLADKMYAGMTDYQFVLGAADKQGNRRLIARLGFKDAIASYSSQAVKYEAGTWFHVAFTYDGAGAGRFYRDGVSLGSGEHPERGAITPGNFGLSIGDRIGSLYHGFPGFIAQVRLCSGVLEFRPIGVALESQRTAFVRMEKVAPLKLRVTNLQKTPLKGASLAVSLDGLNEKKFELPEIAPGTMHAVEYPLDTTLRPDAYKLRAKVLIPGAKLYQSEETFPIALVSRPLPARMPVVMWGVYGAENVLKELPRLKEIGFTHCLGLGADYGPIWDAGAPIAAGKDDRVALTRKMLDTALTQDVGIVASLSPGHWLRGKKELLRIGRDGKVRDAAKADVCALAPGASEFCYNVGASVARTYGQYPAWQAALLHTEVRDAANVCFHDHDRAAYRKATGQEIPAEVTSKAGVRWDKLANFPADRVVPDDHPVLKFLSWYWKEGDGWNGLNTSLHKGLQSTGRSDLWTFHDPAARVASVYGSGGSVDFISQWTYSYPDPIRIGLATDELFAMAGGAAQPQRVMKMTQIIWYRSQTAPMRQGDEKLTAKQSPWEDTDPDAAFPTIAPMHLREAFWSKMARPVQGIMYHGWESLVPTDRTSSYRYTHPQTQHELRRLVKQVVEPLGPALMQIPDRPADVAFLESFASQMLAGRGTYGWGRGWAGDAHHILQYAQLQPQIVFDQTIAARGLSQYRVLVMMDCDVITASVATAAREFQQKGGIIIGDERLAPALKPDILLQSYQRTGKADEDRAALLALAKTLRETLDAKYRRYADSSNPNAIVRTRTHGSSDYLFLVNDLREFGDYVGQHGLVMENGLPSRASLSVQRTAGNVYDLVAGRQLKSAPAGQGAMRFDVALAPCEGGVFMVTRQAIDHVKIDGPTEAKLGASASCRVFVLDAENQPIDAIVPVRIEIRDPQGRDCEFTGFYGAKAGVVDLRLDFASNDSPGLWQIRARELASGQVATLDVRVNR